MEIKDIPKGGFKTNYSELEANIFDDGKFFCATSYDSVWCCTGIIVDYLENMDNPNCILKVNQIYKNTIK